MAHEVFSFYCVVVVVIVVVVVVAALVVAVGRGGDVDGVGGGVQ